MYGLGIHLYGYINLERASQFITTYTGQTNKVSSNNIFNNTFIRTDKLETITYKNININNLPKETLNNIFTNIGVDSEYYSICNLTGNVANVVSSNKKLQTEYIDKTLLKNIDTKQADFINLLSNTLKVKISDIDKSNNYSLNKVYTDYNKDNRISRNINKIAESMLFEYKNNTGYFYYSGLPDVMLHPISGGRVQDGCIRGLD
ncbi:hypothetical protein [Clostridium sp.]|uniref:hypothetical protein n=1 Tax=Clostridium sp. TaxID=1506 RepID=UPI002FC63D81